MNYNTSFIVEFMIIKIINFPNFNFKQKFAWIFRLSADGTVTHKLKH